MIGYLIKTTVCLAIVLLVYLLALEREKMHRFNRVYLLLGLLLALIIPFLPSGEVIHQTYSASPVIFNDGSGIVMQESVAQIKSFTWFSWERLLLSIYSIVLAVMLIKFVRNISQLINKAYSNPKWKHQGAQLVLLNEEVLPHTFLGYIYVNEDQYHNGEIDKKLLAHEYAHAIQRHSWDVIIIELLKAIFWFNPLFVLYKRVIQLNHEFLADEAVIQQYNDVSTYQHLLVDACQNNNQIYLASNINFLLTKKRLTMMTKHSSRKRIYMLMAGVVPVVIALVMMLGQPVVAQEITTPPSDDAMESFMRNDGVKIPHSFSPNGDGKKETLKPYGPIENLESFLLVIFNKYGEIVFQSEDPTEEWNGKKGNSQGVPEGGVYVFVLDYKYSNKEKWNKKGDINLIMDPNQMIPVLEDGDLKNVKISDIDTIPKSPKSPKVNGITTPTITKDRYFKDAIVHFKTTDGRVMVKSYNALPADVKDLLPPPPPLPPALPGEKQSNIMQPLEKGTVVHLKPNGSVVIGNDKEVIDFQMPPAPPKAPMPPKAPSEIGDVPPSPPKPPVVKGSQKAPKPPKPPKTPKEIASNSPTYDELKTKISNEVNYKDGIPLYKGKTVRELANEGAKIYINGKLLLDHVAKTVCDDNSYSSYMVTSCEDGSLKVELEN